MFQTPAASLGMGVAVPLRADLFLTADGCWGVRGVMGQSIFMAGLGLWLGFGIRGEGEGVVEFGGWRNWIGV